MTIGSVHLHIDRVVLRGVPREQRDALMRELRAELARQLAAPDFAKNLHGRHIASIRGGELQVCADAAPDELGARAAQRLVQGIRS
jgi:hypothetical protein